METLEFKAIYQSLWGGLGLVFWLLHLFHVFKKPEVRLSKKFIKKNNILIFGLLCLLGVGGWSFISYSLTYPRIPSGYTPNSAELNDLFLVVDVSKSMLADDFEPNRIEVTKDKIREFILKRPKERIGIIIFSEKIFTLLPLSTDLDLIIKMVDEIQTGPLGAGTNIGDALGLAVARLIPSPAKNKVIVLMTDGVSNVGSMTPLQAAEEAKKENVKIYTIAVGGEKDAKIPVGQSIFGTQYQTIPGGSIDIRSLKEISQMTNAKSFIASDPQALEDVLSELNSLEKTSIEIKGRVIYKELYYKYLTWGILLLGLAEVGRRAFLREGI